MEKRKEGQKEYYITRQNEDGASWQMILIIPENEYEDQYRFLWLSAALMLGSMIAVIVLMSYLLSGYYVGRLKKLNVDMTGLESGNLNANLPITTEEDEIEEIYHNFNGMVQEVQRLMQEHYQLGKEVKMAEVRALQAQINPHFLYNTLDSIAWMCERGKNADAVQMVHALARLFRISISRGHELIPIRSELQHAESYLQIQSHRYKNQFSYSFDVQEECLDYLCNKITLQPIIENAIYHGINGLVDEGEIRISCRADGDDILFTVEDNGTGMEPEQVQAILRKERSDHTGIGF